MFGPCLVKPATERFRKRVGFEAGGRVSRNDRLTVEVKARAGRQVMETVSAMGGKDGWMDGHGGRGSQPAARTWLG